MIGRRNRDNLGVLLLVQHLLFTVGLENIPPVTLGTIGIQICLYLGLVKVSFVVRFVVFIGGISKK